MSDSPSTFLETMAELALLAEKAITPPERARETAASLRQLGNLGGDLPLSMADAAAGFAFLAEDLHGHKYESGKVIAFDSFIGTVFSDLAVLAGDTEGGQHNRLVEVLLTA